MWCSSECTHWTLPTNQSKTKLHMTAYNPKLAGSRARSGQPGNRGGDDRAAAWFFPLLLSISEQFWWNTDTVFISWQMLRNSFAIISCYQTDKCSSSRSATTTIPASTATSAQWRARVTSPALAAGRQRPGKNTTLLCFALQQNGQKLMQLLRNLCMAHWMT